MCGCDWWCISSISVVSGCHASKYLVAILPKNVICGLAIISPIFLPSHDHIDTDNVRFQK